MRQAIRNGLGIGLAVTPALLLFFFHATRYGGWLIDDAGITYAYARNFAAGLGLVAQAGQPPVEGFSNPLWTLLIGLLSFARLFTVPVAPKVLAFLLVFGSFWFFTASLLRMLPRIDALLVAALGLLLTAANPGFVIWCVSGLENPLLAFLAAALLLTSIRAMQADEKDLRRLCIQAGFIAAGLALTRPDALLYTAVFPLACLLREAPLTFRNLARHAIVYGACVVVLYVGYAIFRRAYFGDWLPNTYYAKPGVSTSAITHVLNLNGPGLVRLLDLARAIFPVFSVLAIAAPIGALVWAGYSWRQQNSRYALLLAAFVGIAFGSYLLLPDDWMGEHRFGTIAFPCTYLLTFLLARQAASFLKAERAKRLAVGTLGIAVLIASAPALTMRSEMFRANPVVPLELVASGAANYNSLADGLGLRNASLLIPDLGGTLLLSKLQVVDVAGLCSRDFGRLYFTQQPPQVFAEHILRNVKPDIVHIHQYWAMRSGLPQSQEFLATYVDLGDGDFVRRASLPRDLTDDAARAIKARLKPADGTFVRSSLNSVLTLQVSSAHTHTVAGLTQGH